MHRLDSSFVLGEERIGRWIEERRLGIRADVQHEISRRRAKYGHDASTTLAPQDGPLGRVEHDDEGRRKCRLEHRRRLPDAIASDAHRRVRAEDGPTSSATRSSGRNAATGLDLDEGDANRTERAANVSDLQK